MALLFVALTMQSCAEKETTTAVAKPVIPQLYYAGSDTSVSWDTYSLRNFFRKDGCGKKVYGNYWAKDPLKTGVNMTLQGKPVPTDSIEKWFGVGAIPIKNPGFTPDGEELSGGDQNFDGRRENPYDEINKKNNESFLGMPEWFKSLFWILLGIFLAGLGFWILWWAFTNRPEHAKIGDSKESKHDRRESISEKVATPTAADDVKIIEALRASGGFYHRYADGAVKIDVPKTPKEEVHEAPSDKEKQKPVEDKDAPTQAQAE